MSKTRPTIRELTAADIPLITDIHMLAFSDRPLPILGREAVRRYYEWQFTGPHDLVVGFGAYENDQLIGYIIGGVFRGAFRGYVNKNRGFLAWRVLSHPWFLLNSEIRGRLKQGLDVLIESLFNRQLKTSIITPASEESDTAQPVKSFGLLVIAVHPEYRGIGALMLVREAEKYAIEHGFNQLHHQIHPDNEYNLKFYEMQGHVKRFEPNGEWVGRLRKQL